MLRAVEGATVIALGEQTHGSDANAEARADLVRLLVERDQVRVVALEADFVEVLRIDAWVQGGAGDPGALLGGQRAGWIWNKPALRDLLGWLRDLNASRDESKRLHLVGLDMQTGVAITSATADALDAGADQAMKKKLAELDGCTDTTLDALLPELDARARSRAALVPLVRSLRQCQAASKDGREGTTARERGMADNVVAAAEASGGRRVVVLAHNAHVSKVPLVPDDPPPMGAILAAQAGKRFVAIGTVIGSGDFRGYRLDPQTGRSRDTEVLPLGEPAADWIEGWLKDADAYFLPLVGWTGEPKNVRVVGASYAPDYAEKFVYPVRLEQAFDAVIYLPRA